MPQIKKAAGKIFGVVFNKEEEKAIRAEAAKVIVELEKEIAFEGDAINLWILHTEFGFGPKRLKQFYRAGRLQTDALLAKYELDAGDRSWICMHQLLDKGIDIREWHKELMEETK